MGKSQYLPVSSGWIQLSLLCCCCSFERVGGWLAFLGREEGIRVCVVVLCFFGSLVLVFLLFFFHKTVSLFETLHGRKRNLLAFHPGQELYMAKYQLAA